MTLTKTDRQAFVAFEKSGWEKAANPYHNHWGGLSQQSVEPMLDAAAVIAGCRVLDVATGAGYAAAAAARKGASAVGIDFSDAQVKLARETYPDVEFRQGDAGALPFDENTFDAVVMGFGANHLPDPEAAFCETLRVLKPGGRLAFTVWAMPDAGTGFGVVLSAIERFSISGSKLPPGPPYFRFADGEETERTLRQAGFTEAVTKTVPQFWSHSSPDDVFHAFNEGAVRATALLRAEPDGVREEIRIAVRQEVEEMKQSDAYVIAMPAALSSARKP